MIERWDDLKILLAVARGGTLTAASKALKIDQTTVTRRMKSLEKELNVSLFERLRGGVELTPAGEVLVMTAEQWEANLFEASRKLDSGRAALTGSVRLTMPELLAFPLMDRLLSFTRTYPSLQLELIAGDELHSLTRREADVALRITQTPPDHLIAKKFGQLATAIYAASAFDDVPLTELPWIGWDLVEAPNSQIEANRLALAPDTPYTMLVNSYGMLMSGLCQGAGATFLPCLSGDAMPGISRRTPPTLLPGHVWMLTHPDLRKSGRVRAMTEFLEGLLVLKRGALLGEEGKTINPPKAE